MDEGVYEGGLYDNDASGGRNEPAIYETVRAAAYRTSVNLSMYLTGRSLEFICTWYVSYKVQDSTSGLTVCWHAVRTTFRSQVRLVFV